MALPDIFVVGVPRSGTSWVTSEIHKAGWWVGSYSSSRANPLGFYEHNGIKNRFIKPFLPDPAGLRKFADVESDVTREGFERVLIDDGWRPGPWVFKDCKILLCRDSFRSAFPDALWVKVRRHPSDVIPSLIRTFHLTRDEAERAHSEYMARLMRVDGIEVWPFRNGIPALIDGLTGGA